MKILVTGFEAFGKSKKNASEEAVKKLFNEMFPQDELITSILPVIHIEAGKKLHQLLAKHSPDCVLCLGESGRAVISLEKVAVNYLDFRIPDNAGFQPKGAPVNPLGQNAYFSTLAVMELKEKMVQSGIPTEISLSAGAYLCNEIFYTLMEWVGKQEKCVQAGFIHLPILPEIAAKLPNSNPSMSTDVVVAGLKIIIDALDK